MRFRPLPLLTLLTLPALALLLGLGIWQLQRAEEKAARITQYQARADAPPVDLEAALCAGEAAPGRRVEDRAIARSPAYVRVYGVDSSGRPGWRLFSPVALPDCAGAGHILAEIAFDPIAGGERSGRVFLDEGPFRLAPPQRAGPFTPAPEPERARFYAYDAAAMAGALPPSVRALSDAWWVIAGEAALPAHLADVPPGRHIGYAITWFGFALALIAVYLAFHAARGRRTFTRAKE